MDSAIYHACMSSQYVHNDDVAVNGLGNFANACPFQSSWMQLPGAYFEYDRLVLSVANLIDLVWFKLFDAELSPKRHGGGDRDPNRWGKRETIGYLTLHCHDHNDSCNKMGSNNRAVLMFH